ncbi:hypothetical protein [Saccharothrix xinjiangensis]|uniref:HAF family extracellular repeat protein n=1 Tax=Saccharothrix xinjiangensis TaxID=204798 RepID=A0ABV9Y6S8_9PSEU
MSNELKTRVLAAAVLAAGLVVVSPQTGQAAAAACTWQGTGWELPAEANGGTLQGYDGSRYAVGTTGKYVPFTGLTNPRGTLWDNGKIVLRATAATPRYRDVSRSGLVVGNDVVGGRTVAVTIGRDGGATVLPGDAAWTGYSAELVNGAGDVYGYADTAARDVVVVWPASAPGTYRELPAPDVDFIRPVDVDDQGRVVAITGTASGGGLVRDTDGRWRVLAAQGAGGYSDPRAIRGGRVVGSQGTDAGHAATEWTARGALVRTFRDAAVAFAIGGNGTVGGRTVVSAGQRTVLWRDGVVVDRLSAVPWTYSLRWISDDESTLVGSDGGRPVQYRCS